jgi:hypothetical protein
LEYVEKAALPGMDVEDVSQKNKRGDQACKDCEESAETGHPALARRFRKQQAERAKKSGASEGNAHPQPTGGKDLAQRREEREAEGTDGD